jgi:hypothetical protein
VNQMTLPKTSLTTIWTFGHLGVKPPQHIFS